MLDKIYEEEIDKRENEITKLSEMKIDNGIKVGDVIELSLVDNNEIIQYILKENFRNEKFSPTYARKKQAMVYNQEDIFIRAILSNIIIIFEKFLSAQYSILVYHKPKEYFENKMISISDLLEKDLDNIINQEIENEVNANMFDSIKVLDKIFEKSSIDLDRYIKIRKEFEEIYYRRNLFVHNNGIVNKLYISKVDAKFLKDISVGQKLICDDIYLDNAILLLKKVIISLHCEMLKCLGAVQEDHDCIANYGFEVLNKEQYLLAEFVYGILRKKKEFEFECKITYELNYINALKQQGKEINALTNAIDVSIAVDKYKIAKACLLNDDAMVYELLSASYPNSFCAIMIREWPIFINFRETEYYKKFVTEHKKDFEIFEFEENL